MDSPTCYRNYHLYSCTIYSWLACVIKGWAHYEYSFKGLTRPALIRGLGVPLYPFLGMCIICVLLGVWIHEAMYALILPGWYAIRRVTQFDERFLTFCIWELLSKGILYQTSDSAQSIMRGASTTKLIFQKWITLWSWKTSLLLKS